MSAFLDWIIRFYAYMAVFPFLPFVAFWLVFYLFNKDKRKSTKAAMDLTSFLLIGSVSAMFNHIFNLGFSFFWVICIVYLISAGLLGSAQNKRRGRRIWAGGRLGFLGLSLLYIILVIIGVVVNMGS